jgi:hypothetical protein
MEETKQTVRVRVLQRHITVNWRRPVELFVVAQTVAVAVTVVYGGRQLGIGLAGAVRRNPKTLQR